MIRLPIGQGDFRRDIKVELDGNVGLLGIIRQIGNDYGVRRNETGCFTYTLLLDSLRLGTLGSIVDISPKTLIRVAPGAIYSFEPALGEQPSKMRKGDLPYNPIKTVSFIPPMLAEPTKTGFDKVRLYRPDVRTRDWFCGYYNDGEELGMSPIELAHGYVDRDYLTDRARNTPHYHSSIIEGWIPIYGNVEALFGPVRGFPGSANRFWPVLKEGESLENIILKFETNTQVGIPLDSLTITTPGEAHVQTGLTDSQVWETITFKYPGLGRLESEKDRVPYSLD